MPAHLTAMFVAQFAHRSRVRPEPVGDDHLCRTMPLQSLAHEAQGRGFVPFARDVALQDLAFVIDRPPEVHHLATQLHVHLVEVPAPMPKAAHPVHPLATDIGCEHRSKPVPPQPNRFMTYVDAALEQQVHDVAQAQRKADVHHHHEPDHLRQ